MGVRLFDGRGAHHVLSSRCLRGVEVSGRGKWSKRFEVAADPFVPFEVGPGSAQPHPLISARTAFPVRRILLELRAIVRLALKFFPGSRTRAVPNRDNTSVA